MFSPQISLAASAKTSGLDRLKSMSGKLAEIKIRVKLINLSGYIFTNAEILSTSVNPNNLFV